MLKDGILKRIQLRSKDYSLHDSVMHKVDNLGRAIDKGRIPKRKIYLALIDAMGQAYRHGMQHGCNIMQGKEDRYEL